MQDYHRVRREECASKQNSLALTSGKSPAVLSHTLVKSFGETSHDLVQPGRRNRWVVVVNQELTLYGEVVSNGSAEQRSVVRLRKKYVTHISCGWRQQITPVNAKVTMRCGSSRTKQIAELCCSHVVCLNTDN